MLETQWLKGRALLIAFGTKKPQDFQYQNEQQSVAMPVQKNKIGVYLWSLWFCLEKTINERGVHSKEHCLCRVWGYEFSSFAVPPRVINL